MSWDIRSGSFVIPPSARDTRASPGSLRTSPRTPCNFARNQPSSRCSVGTSAHGMQAMPCAGSPLKVGTRTRPCGTRASPCGPQTRRRDLRTSPHGTRTRQEPQRRSPGGGRRPIPGALRSRRTSSRVSLRSTRATSSLLSCWTLGGRTSIGGQECYPQRLSGMRPALAWPGARPAWVSPPANRFLMRHRPFGQASNAVLARLSRSGFYRR